ncbi:MAG: cytochrome C oxidase subunit IV family protein [Actinomycetota bacterium]|nr:cytochrome C oxidase subunit IV family protein [Actinomycetota bacterium]
MRSLLRSAPSVTWLVLVAATAGSYLIGSERGLRDRDAVAAFLLALAFAKVALVGRQFMELQHAAPLLRRAFDLYAVVTGSVLVVLILVL